MDFIDNLFFFCFWLWYLIGLVVIWLKFDFILIFLKSLYYYLNKFKIGRDKNLYVIGFGVVLYYIWLCRGKKFYGELFWNIK